MATVQTRINRAMRLIGATASGESPTSQESADCLTALNAMLESWQTEKLIVYAFVDTGFTMVNGTGSYSLGPSANFNLTPRPSKIENCYVKANNIDYPLEPVDKNRWFSIADKTVQSDIPILAYYEPSLPNGTIRLWPIPNAAHSLHVVTWTPVSSFAALTDSVTLPQGYNRAIDYNLAVEIAPEYELEASDTVKRIAMDSMASIKRANNRPMKAYTELGLMFGGNRSDIYSGGGV